MVPAAAGLPPPTGPADQAGSLRERFRVAEQGFAAEVTTPAVESPRADPVARHREQREQEMVALVDDALDLLQSTGEDRDAEAVRTRALVEGLGLAVCTGRPTSRQAVASLERHLTRLARGLG